MGTPQGIWIGVLLLQACLLTVRGQDCPWPCATCSTSNDCTECGPGFYLSVYSSCEACPVYCERCDASGCLADGCYGGFYINGSDCLPCPRNCGSCTASGCSAGGCYSGFYNSGTGCQRCSERCFNCTSANTCDSCASGYYLSNGICTECVIGCDSCSNGDVCTPEGCQSRLTYNPTTQLCDGCPWQCPACANTIPNACIACWQGYYLTARNMCEPCPYECSACTNQTYCTSCNQQYYLSADNTCKAIACSAGCTECVSASMCIVCDFGYSFNNNTCTACPPNCWWCDASGCLDDGCYWGYYNSGTGCKRCTLIGCNTCLTSDTCVSTACNGGFAYNPTTQRCDVCTAHCNSCLYGGTCLPNQCRTGYTFDTATKTCIACAAHCDYCFESNTCEPGGCAIGYSYDPVSQACFVCTPQCEECLIPGTCIPEACASGTAYNYTTHTCDACSPGCDRCPTPGTCYANMCSQNYIYQNNMYQNYMYNSMSQTCQYGSCSVACNRCVSPNTCLPNSCYEGYMYDAVSQTCKKCAYNCMECTTPRTCLPTGCQSGTVYDTESKTCLTCAPYCTKCSSPGTCLPNGCSSGYSYVFDSPSLPCVACEADKPCVSAKCGSGAAYNVTTQTCVACPVGCNYCESGGTCLSIGGCSWSYALNVTSGRCERCSDNCRSCSEPGTCSPNQCYSFSWVLFAFNSTSRRCEACSPYCQQCDTPGTCYRCREGFTLNTTTQQCDACPPNCYGCDTPGICYSCWTGYVLNYTTMQCEACALNCYRCTQPNTCTDTGCFYNYIYDRVNKTCKMDSPCNKDVMQCNNRGTCQPTDNSPYYLCTCNTGYTGSQCEQKIASRLYPHGYSTGDRVLLNTDDGSTPRIVFGQPFLFYGRFQTSAFVNMNGFISFSKNYPVYRPMPFPHQNSEQADLLAPFWADADSSGIFYNCGPSNPFCAYCDCGPGCPTCGTDVVYYQIYSKAGGNINATLTKAVLDKATADGWNYISGFGSADWVLVVTWAQVIPFRYTSNRYSYERNTFQAVLAMDSANLKSFVTFRYDEIRWNSIRPAMMGIQAAASNYYYNYPSSDVYQLADLNGYGSSEMGVSVFDTAGSVTPSANIRCVQWVARERWRQTEVRSYVDQLPPCPCSGFQALFTPAYRWITGTDCFVSVDKSIVNTNGTIVGVKCCYDWNVWMWSNRWVQWSWMWTWVWLGDLVSSPLAEAGGFYDSNPLYYSPANIAEDNMKTDCCVNSANCPAYFSVRPIKTCAGYRAPRLSWIFGDPHITTLDGLAYDYNGIGEYWLIKSPVLQVQARTSQATDGVSGAPVNASIFTAFAIQVPEGVGQNLSDRVVVLMTSSTQLELYVIPKTQPDTARVNLTDWMTNTTAQPTPDTLNTYPGFVLRRLAEGTGVIVNVDSGPSTLILRLEAGQLSMTSVPGANLVGKTGGLLGTYDDNTTNDLTLANGTVLPADSSPQTIYNTFGESWRTRSNESLMYYSAGDSHAAHQQPSFVPMFTATFTSQTSERTARDLCGDDSNCLLDYAATNNAQLALTSANNTHTGKSTNQLFSSSQPVVQGPSVWRVTVGQVFTATYTTTNEDGSSVILRASGLPDGASLNRTTGVVTWTPALTAPVFNVSINTVSDRGVPALNVLVTVYLCDGCSSHGQCEFDIAPPTNLSYRFQQVTCLCADGYTGNSCEQETDPCANAPCGVGATCEPVPAGHVNIYNLTYNCTACAPGFTLDLGKCVDSDVADLNDRNNQSACSSQPCQNNGACQGTQTAYTCTCSEEYSGMLCETRIVTTTTLTTATPVTTTKLTTTTTPVTTTKRTTTTTLPPQKTALTKKTTLPSQTVKSSTVSTVAKTASARPKVTRTSAVTVTTGVPKSAATSLAQTVWVVTAALSTGLLLIG